MPTTSTIIGYVASGLVLTTFWTNDLRRLRMLAILSNIAFISYGALVWLPPVLGLHLLLLPLNTARLMRMSKTPPEGRPPQPSAMEEYMLATIQSAVLLGRRSLATLRRRLAREDKRLTKLQRDGMIAWHFF